MIVIVLAFADEVAASLHVLKLDDSAARDLLALLHQVLGRRIEALHDPIVAFVALTLVTKARHLVFSGQR